MKLFNSFKAQPKFEYVAVMEDGLEVDVRYTLTSGDTLEETLVGSLVEGYGDDYKSRIKDFFFRGPKVYETKSSFILSNVVKADILATRPKQVKVIRRRQVNA